MTDRRAEDFRRIVNFKITKGGLPLAEDRDTIEGKRAIAFETGTRLGFPGETLAPTDTDGVTTDGQDNPFDDLFFASTDNSFGADAVLDGDLKVGDELKELMAEDCVSGDDLDIRTDGEIPPPGAVHYDSGELKSARWTAPDEPPVLAGFVLGVHWFGSDDNGADVFGETPGACAEAYISSEDAPPFGGGDTGNARVTNVTFLTTTTRQIEITLDNPAFPVSGRAHTHIIASTACTLDVDAACPSVAPVETAFPEDNKTTLSLVDGKFTASEFESETPTEYSGKGVSIIDFCTAGGRFGRMEPTSDGGFMISERDSKGGTLTAGGQYMVFGADRKLQGSVSEESAETLRPKNPTPVT